MQSKLAKINKVGSINSVYSTIGHIVEVDSDGFVKVDYPENKHGSLIAKVIGVEHFTYKMGCSVLLIFETNNLQLPIIIGIVSEKLTPPCSEELSFPLNQRIDEALIDGNKTVIDAKKEIVLRCGKSSITLLREGKVIIKGVSITSRASQNNKVKGGSVNIN